MKLTIEEIVDKPGFHDSPRHISGHKLNIKQGDPSRKEVEGKCILEYNDPGRCDVIAVDPVRHATGAVQLADHLEVNGIYRAFEVKILATGGNGLAEVGVGLAYDFDEADGEVHGDLESQVRAHIIGHARIYHVGKYQSCMVSKSGIAARLEQGLRRLPLRQRQAVRRVGGGP